MTCIFYNSVRKKCYLFAENKIFLDILLELNDAGSNFSDDDLRDEVVTMMIAVCSFLVNFLKIVIKIIKKYNIG